MGRILGENRTNSQADAEEDSRKSEPGLKPDGDDHNRSGRNHQFKAPHVQYVAKKSVRPVWPIFIFKAIYRDFMKSTSVGSRVSTVFSADD